MKLECVGNDASDYLSWWNSYVTSWKAYRDRCVIRILIYFISMYVASRLGGKSAYIKLSIWLVTRVIEVIVSESIISPQADFEWSYIKYNMYGGYIRYYDLTRRRITFQVCSQLSTSYVRHNTPSRKVLRPILLATDDAAGVRCHVGLRPLANWRKNMEKIWLRGASYTNENRVYISVPCLMSCRGIRVIEVIHQCHYTT